MRVLLLATVEVLQWLRPAGAARERPLPVEPSYDVASNIWQAHDGVALDDDV
jgi:hypothetical protein